jgi:hypothetical protein
MAIVRDPISFTEHFRIDPSILGSLSILDPILNVDTRLFIDPILLDASGHPEISRHATASFRSYFQDVISLLKASTRKEDAPWREAKRRFYFPEVPGTCLGYGKASIRGSAFGPSLTARLIDTAKEIVNLGVADPDLFKLLPLLEEGVGPDLISDMTTNVILKDLFMLTASTCKKLGIPTWRFGLAREEFLLPRNPTQERSTPIILVPKDILRSLPVASDWSEVADAASKNATIRARVNQLIGNIWLLKTRREKERIRIRVLASKEAFEVLLSVICKADVRPYDLERDPKGLVTWHKVREKIAREFPLVLTLPRPPKKENAIALVCAIVEQFKTLIETKGIWKALWNNGTPRNEKNAQMVFFAIADTYCKANNLDVTPEADTGAGPVDFKFSAGYSVRILVEIKLSTNPKLIHGYTRQLEAYKDAQTPVSAFYIVIDVGGMGRKDKQLLEINSAKPKGSLPDSEIVFVNGKRRASASRR